MTLNDLQQAAGLMVIITIIIQLVKPWIEEKAIPLVAVATGIVVALLVSVVLGATTAADLGNAVLTGLLGGAASSGIYAIQKPIGLLASKE